MIQSKILVVGVSASGKSTFARKLSNKTELPITHMDRIMWQPGWKYVGDAVVEEKLRNIASRTEWIIEGYIPEAMRAELFDAADQIVYLDYPGWLSACRYVKRWWQHRVTPRLELPGSPETFSFKFLKLVFTKGETRKLNQLLASGRWASTLVRFTSPKQAKQYIVPR